MKDYELVLILKAESQEEKNKKTIKSVEKIITSLKGKTKKVTSWAKREFAYPIKKFKKGAYFLLNLQMPADSLDNFNKKLKLDSDIIRFLIISQKQGTEKN